MAVLACLATAAFAAPPKPAAKGAEPGPSLTLVYGDNHVFGLVPPKGWAIDDSSGLGSRIRVVLYPHGQKWASAPTVMYANPLHQDPRKPRTLAQMIQHDIERFGQANPRGKVTPAPMIRTLKGQTAQVRHFAPGGSEPSEAVAYIAEDELVILLVLSSREPGGFKKALPAFRSLVQHYQFVGGGIQTPTAR